MSQADILKKILARKAQEIVERNEQLPLKQLSQQVESLGPCRGFVQQLKHKVGQGQAAVIAEIKKASPSKGVLCDHFDPATLARQYAEAGAACLSVLTDADFFQGSLQHLQAARAQVQLPVLRKDFIIDVYQVYEARQAQADCILLIAAALGDTQMQELCDLAFSLGMDVLVEVHNKIELERALLLPTPLIGINNRNLHTFETRLETTYDLLDSIPKDRIVVTESGIAQVEHVKEMRQHGVHCFLVGESLVKHSDPAEKFRQLFLTD